MTCGQQLIPWGSLNHGPSDLFFKDYKLSAPEGTLGVRSGETSTEETRCVQAAFPFSITWSRRLVLGG